MNKVRKTSYESLFFSRTEQFLKMYLINQTASSLHTEKGYRESLSVFYDYVTKSLKISPMTFQFTDCTYILVLNFSEYMQTELKYAKSTVNTRLSAIKSYLGYVAADDFSLTSVYLSVKKVPMLTVPKIIKPIIEPENVKYLLEIPKKTRIGNRDKFILVLLFDSAIRVSELTGITLGDIIVDKTDITIVIHGKGRKEREIVLSKKSAKHMINYMKAFHPYNEDKSRPLFYSSIHGNISPMSARNIERIVSKYGKLAHDEIPSIPEKVYPHMMRRTRATTLYREGVPIEQVSAILGHQHMETTRLHYASPSAEQMKIAISNGSNYESDAVPEWIGREDEIKKKFGLK